MRLRVLAVFAHPDDATWLAGGTLARLAACGADVRLLCLTCGDAPWPDDADGSRLARAAAVEQRELEAACEALGIRRPIAGGCLPGALATECRQSVDYGITRALATLRPELVVTFGPDGVTRNPDHVAIGEITTAAFRRVFGPTAATAPGARLYYALGSAALRRVRPRGLAGDALHVTTVIDVTSVVERKLAAVQGQRTSASARPEDVAAIGLTLTVSEQFHRAAPAWSGGTMETALGDLLAGVPCGAPARRNRIRREARRVPLSRAA
jgi:N-acetylglucosamine malate deacetylase 2